MPQKFFSPTPESFKGFTINHGHLGNGQPAWEAYNELSQFGFFRMTKSELMDAIAFYSSSTNNIMKYEHTAQATDNPQL